MYLIINTNTSPQFNLALEEYVLTGMEIETIILWRNSKAVIIGNNQNAASEIDMDYVSEHNIPVIRRQSGGGAVFHDLGNVNFTIIQTVKRGDFSNYTLFTSPIIQFLATLGVRASLKGRNDLVIDDMKFCGNAQAMKKGRIMHHGCILYSADFSDLGNALKPRDIKIESHGVKSVRSRVTNIAHHMENPIPVEEFFALMADFFMALDGIEPYELNDLDIEATERLAREKYSSWEWNFGKSGAYNMERSARYSYGIVDVRLSVEFGVMRDLHIYGDFFGILDKSELEGLMRNIRHERGSIREALRQTDIDMYISGMTVDEWVELIA
ncbi:MAG: lipoate--protein ligase [Synergistaceae bacterium]|jgi:lipoate-protein ligase A|nr:lipoate--protein ligase [Synergistaceae bacterium]